MRQICTVATIMLFILVFEDVDGKKDYKDYNLPHGPKKLETWKYLFKPKIGDPQYCMYCPLESLKNSKYSYKQQPLCLKKYEGMNFTDVLLHEEIENRQFPFCDVGDMPGCGPPPEVNRTKKHIWVCDPGYGLKEHSPYFTCALVCNISDNVDWLYYCNESLRWEFERPSNWQNCDAPIVVESTDNLKIIGIAVGSVSAAMIILVVAYCSYRCYKKKIRPIADEKKNGNIFEGKLTQGPWKTEIREENENGHGIEDVVPENRPGMRSGRQSLSSGTSVRSSNLGSSRSRTPDSSIENVPLIPPAAAAGFKIEDEGIGTRSIGSGPDEDEQNTETSILLSPDAHGDNLEVLGAVGGHDSGEEPPRVASGNNDNAEPQVKPSVCIVQTKKEESIPLQGNIYSIERDSDFQVVPNSTGGYGVNQFRIERKDDNRPFKWEMHLSIYYVQGASELDAGLYMWKMILDNNEEYFGCFEISISLPAIRPPPLGEEAQGKGTSIINTANPVVIQRQQLSSAPHLNVQSILDTQKNNSIVPPFLQLPNVRGEVERETNDPFRNTNPLSSEMFSNRLNEDGNHLDSGVNSSNGLRSGRSSHLPSSRAVRQRHNARDNDTAGDIRYSTSGYESQSSTSLAREQFRANFENVSNLDIASFDERLGDSRMSSPGSDIAQNFLSRGGYRDLLQEVEEENTSSRLRPDPAGNVSPIHHTESNDSLHQTGRKEIYVVNGTQEPLPRQHDGDVRGGSDVDSLSDRLDSVALHREFHISDPEFEEVVDITENPRAEIQQLSYRHDTEAENKVECNENITDDNDVTENL